MGAFTLQTAGEKLIEGMVPLAFEAYESFEKVFPRMFNVEKSEYPTHSRGSDFLLDVQVTEDSVERGVIRRGANSEISSNYAWLIKNRTFTASVPIAKTALEDLFASNIDAFAAKVAPGMAKEFLRVQEQRHADIFNLGAMAAGSRIFDNSVISGHASGVDALTDPSGLFIYDGEPLFSASHPMRNDSGTLSNYTATAPLTVANLEAAQLAFNSTNARDNSNKIIVRRANALVVPPQLEIQARKILESANIPFEMTSTKNVIGSIASKWELIVNPYLTDTDGWFLLDTTMSGLLSIYHPNYPPTGTTAIPFKLSLNTSGDVWSIDATARWGVGISNWRPVHAFNLSSS